MFKNVIDFLKLALNFTVDDRKSLAELIDDAEKNNDFNHANEPTSIHAPHIDNDISIRQWSMSQAALDRRTFIINFINQLLAFGFTEPTTNTTSPSFALTKRDVVLTSLCTNRFFFCFVLLFDAFCELTSNNALM